MTEHMELVQNLSAGLADAVKAGEEYTARVDGRRGYGASGVFYGGKHVLASSHTVHAEEGIRIVDYQGKEYEARVVGRDQIHDLVLLELSEEWNGETQTSVKAPQVGELVLALARPSEDGIQASLGIVGVSGGTYIGGHGPALKGMIRTDAEQFPGFSGGPLVNAEGKLIGINIMGRRYGSFLTLPVEKAFAIAEKIREKGNIKQAYLGIRSQPAELPPELPSGIQHDQDHGLLVVSVENDSPAALAKVMTGDILVGIDGGAVSSPGELLDVLAEKTEGDTARLDLLRGGVLTHLQVTLGGRDLERHHGHKRMRRRPLHGHPGHPGKHDSGGRKHGR